MKRPLALLWLILLLPLAIGDPAHPRIHGVVLDDGGDPIAGARVWLRSANAACILVPEHSFLSTTTDAGGAFSFVEPPEDMEFFVEHEGHADAWTPARNGVILRMQAGAYLTGSLPEGCALVATVGLRELAAHRGAGDFRIGPLPVGEAITVTAESECHRTYQTRVVLAAGDEWRIDLPLDPGLAVHGRVVPAEAGVVIRASQGEGRESRAVTDADGNFTLTGLRNGCACLVVQAGDADPFVVSTNAGTFTEVRLDR